jgi:hypothetical protein
MSLLKRLQRLDTKVNRRLRQPGEDAEAFLRRTAAGKPISQLQAYEVQRALREYFRDK